MFRLRKLCPPYGTREAPVIEVSYAEGEIRVVDGLCEVHLPETRERLLKMGFEDAPSQREPQAPIEQVPVPQPICQPPKAAPRKVRR